MYPIVVYLISGLPGSGKSTTARLLAGTFPRAAHIESDVVQEFTVSGRVPPCGQPEAEAQRQLDLRTRNLAALAHNFAIDDFVPIIDDLVATRKRLEQFQSLLPAHRLHLVVLCPSLLVVRRRLQHRERRLDARLDEYFAGIDAQMRIELSDVGQWVDTGILTPQQTVGAIRTPHE